MASLCLDWTFRSLVFGLGGHGNEATTDEDTGIYVKMDCLLSESSSKLQY